MIVVTMELWPGGSEHGKQTLARGIIVNDGTGSMQRGNYYAVLEGKTARYRRTSEVKGYPRLSRSPWELLRRVLNNVDRDL